MTKHVVGTVFAHHHGGDGERKKIELCAGGPCAARMVSAAKTTTSPATNTV